MFLFYFLKLFIHLINKDFDKDFTILLFLLKFGIFQNYKVSSGLALIKLSPNGLSSVKRTLSLWPFNLAILFNPFTDQILISFFGCPWLVITWFEFFKGNIEHIYDPVSLSYINYFEFKFQIFNLKSFVPPPVKKIPDY